ncbi:MAG: threonine/serine exporter family protein [Candidatus Onthomonas sp.]
MEEAVKLVILSFCASVGFAIIFRMRGRDLLLEGVGGAITRGAYLLLLSCVESRILYSMLAALVAAIYAELIATHKKVPTTYFLYPSIIPLIPGDLLYNTAVGFLTRDAEMTLANGQSCALTLIGMCIGFVLSSTVIHYIRLYQDRLVQAEKKLSVQFKKR